MTYDQLEQMAHDLIIQYRHEIVRDGDWWHGTEEYSFNIHSPNNDNLFNINVYKHDPVTGMDNYDHWLDFKPVYLGGSISMRADLAEEGMSVPASRTFSNYDRLDDVVYVSAEELEGATYANDPADPDDHPFCYVELKDGRCMYFISADLDFD